MRFGDYYKDLELLSGQPKAHPLGTREVKNHGSPVPRHELSTLWLFFPSPILSLFIAIGQILMLAAF